MGVMCHDIQCIILLNIWLHNHLSAYTNTGSQSTAPTMGVQVSELHHCQMEGHLVQQIMFSAQTTLPLPAPIVFYIVNFLRKLKPSIAEWGFSDSWVDEYMCIIYLRNGCPNLAVWQRFWCTASVHLLKGFGATIVVSPNFKRQIEILLQPTKQ